MPEYEPVIGLEVHAELKTKSKMFCRCSTLFGNAPNSQTCPVCLGMPGVLPVINKRAVDFAIRLAIASGSRIAPRSIFARKNYFYPDLPKAYQISQYEQPLALDGHVTIRLDGALKKIGLTRIHMEEDTGKLLHPDSTYPHGSRIDFNRCGIPLLEIVSEPEIETPHEAYLYLSKLRQMLLYLDICDGNMEEGSLRCDVNISVREAGSTKLGTKAEIKNINSFRGAEKALQYEIQRQISVLEQGGKIIQQTLDWDAAKGMALPIRSKEEAHDYRYFPEPDLIPLKIFPEWIDEIQNSLPELPNARMIRYEQEYNLPPYDAEVLTATPEIAAYYEAVVKGGADPKKASNWVMTEVMRVLNERKIGIIDFKVSPVCLAQLLSSIDSGAISGKIAKEIFELQADTGKSPDEIIREKGLIQITDTDAIGVAVDKALESNPKEVEAYLKGKEKLIGFFVGEIMKSLRGKGNPKTINILLKDKLDLLRNK